MMMMMMMMSTTAPFPLVLFDIHGIVEAVPELGIHLFDHLGRYTDRTNLHPVFITPKTSDKHTGTRTHSRKKK